MILDEIYGNLIIENEEEMIVGEENVLNKKESFIIIGKFLTQKNINFGTM